MILRDAFACTVALALAAPLGCSRRPPTTAAPRGSAAVAPSRPRAPVAEAAREHAGETAAARRAAEPEGDDDEIMERAHDISPFPPTEAGLAHLFREVHEAHERGDRARLEALVRPLAPAREPLSLALTFDGARAIGPYLLAQPGTSAAEIVTRAEQQWGRATGVEVSSATAGEIAQGAPAASHVDPGMRAIAQYLRPLVRWYRVTLRGPGPQDRVVVESLLYAGGRWMFVPAPWRMAPGSPARGAVDPGTAWTVGTRVDLSGAPTAPAATAGQRPAARERERE